MIYEVNRKKEKMSLVGIIEFAFNDKEIIFRTDDDVDSIITESTVSVLNEGHHGHPGVMITIDGLRFKVQFIPKRAFIGHYSSNRINVVRGSGDNNLAGTRRIYYGDEDGYNRGVITVNRNDKDHFEDTKLMTKDILDATMGFVYHYIDDIEKFRDGYISKDDLQDLADDFSKLSTKEKKELAKQAKRNGSN